MFVTFDPEDTTEPRKHEFVPEDLLTSEAIAIEKAYGASFEVWLNALRVKEAKARRVLLWHITKMEGHKNLRFEDTPDFRMRQLTVEMSVKELRELYDQIARTKMDDTTRDAFEAAFDRDIADAMERETGVVEGTIEEAPNLPKAR